MESSQKQRGKQCPEARYHDQLLHSAKALIYVKLRFVIGGHTNEITLWSLNLFCQFLWTSRI